MSCNSSPVGRLLLLFVSLTLLGSLANAQTISGTITGTVVDSSAAAVPDAAVTLTNESTQETRNTKSDTSGEFVFAALQPGTYTVSVTKQGFETVRRTGLLLQTNQRLATGSIALTIGQTTQTLTVNSEAVGINTGECRRRARASADAGAKHPRCG